MGWDDSPDYGNPTPTWRDILVGVLVFAAAALAVAYAYGAEFSGTVSKVIDGDTLWLCDQIACRKIRLCGINAPERGSQAIAKAAML